MDDRRTFAHDRAWGVEISVDSRYRVVNPAGRPEGPAFRSLDAAWDYAAVRAGWRRWAPRAARPSMQNWRQPPK